jgi:hypothetical protein
LRLLLPLLLLRLLWLLWLLSRPLLLSVPLPLLLLPWLRLRLRNRRRLRTSRRAMSPPCLPPSGSARARRLLLRLQLWICCVRG